MLRGKVVQVVMAVISLPFLEVFGKVLITSFNFRLIARLTGRVIF